MIRTSKSFATNKDWDVLSEKHFDYCMPVKMFFSFNCWRKLLYKKFEHNTDELKSDWSILKEPNKYLMAENKKLKSDLQKLKHELG